MDIATKAELVKRIDQEFTRTEETIAEYKDLAKPVAPENAIGRLSRMDAINNKSITEAALREAEKKLSNLKLIRSKVDDPSFGRCEKCKGEIPIGRLMLLPQARRCVSCA